MQFIPSLLTLILGVAATGIVGGAWVNYGEVTPATMMYIVQDATQPSLSSPADTTQTVPTAPVPSSGAATSIEPTVPTTPMPPAATEGSSGGGTSGALPLPPLERPTMPPPSDQTGAQEYSGQQPPSIQPMPPQRDNQPKEMMPPQRNGGRGEMRPSMPPQRRNEDHPQTLPGGNGQEGNQMMPQGNEGEDFQEPQIDPREIRQVLREITQMQRDLKRFLTQLKKYNADTSEVDRITEELNKIRPILGGSDMDAIRDAIQDFRDANYWETIQAIRAKVEVPQQIARMKKELTRLEKTTASSAYKKLNVDMAQIVEYINDSRARIAQMEEFLNAGNLEELMDVLNELHNTPMPMEIVGLLDQLKNFNSQINRLKGDSKAKAQELLSGVIQKINEGEFREARELLNQVMKSLQQLFNSSGRTKVKNVFGK